MCGSTGTTHPDASSIKTYWHQNRLNVSIRRDESSTTTQPPKTDWTLFVIQRANLDLVTQCMSGWILPEDYVKQYKCRWNTVPFIAMIKRVSSWSNNYNTRQKSMEDPFIIFYARSHRQMYIPINKMTWYNSVEFFLNNSYVLTFFYLVICFTTLQTNNKLENIWNTHIHKHNGFHTPNERYAVATQLSRHSSKIIYFHMYTALKCVMMSIVLYMQKKQDCLGWKPIDCKLVWLKWPRAKQRQ